MLVVDNVAAPFKLTPRFSLERRLKLIEKFTHDLRVICAKYKISVIAINQLTKKLIRNENEGENIFQFIPFLGKTWSNSIDFSIKLDGDDKSGR